MCVIIVLFLDIVSCGVNGLKTNILTKLLSQMNRYEKTCARCIIYRYIYAFLNATVFNHTD